MIFSVFYVMSNIVTMHLRFLTLVTAQVKSLSILIGTILNVVYVIYPFVRYCFIKFILGPPARFFRKFNYPRIIAS